MKKDSLDLDRIRPLVEIALQEDVGTGDLTSKALVPEGMRGLAVIVTKERGILAGIDIAKLVFECVDEKLDFIHEMRDGDKFTSGRVIAQIRGSARSCLVGERVALNFLQRLSGIATFTSKYVEAVRGTRARIMDTRKTTPALRMLEKYAVRVGGGENHRFGLYDQILIKENHIDAAMGIGNAVTSIKESNGQRIFIEIEVSVLSGVKEALKAGVNRIMLDNMDIKRIREAVTLIRNADSMGLEIEVSGNVTLETVREIAETGVDIISVGALTHSARALDISMRLRRIGK
jgi:nicotinate-nucleotide pyrophosphorylase (carboxylating)